MAELCYGEAAASLAGAGAAVLRDPGRHPAARVVIAQQATGVVGDGDGRGLRRSSCSPERPAIRRHGSHLRRR